MKTLLTSLLILMIATGCETLPQVNAPTVIGGGLGALIGHEVSDGEPLGTVAGAIGGALAGAGVQQWQAGRERDAWKSGEAAAKANAAKRAHRLRKLEDHVLGGEILDRRYYQVPVPGHIKDGVKILPHSRIIEVVE